MTTDTTGPAPGDDTTPGDQLLGALAGALFVLCALAWMAFMLWQLTWEAVG